MASSTERNASLADDRLVSPETSDRRRAILQEMEKILKSQPFRTSTRSKQFLEYVVLQSLDGHTEDLKERTIGAEVYKRDADYSTGDDPVVRVQAGEVRRRLEQYYHTASGDLPVHIEIPLGSYVPEFRWKTADLAVESPVRPQAEDLPKDVTEEAGHVPEMGAPRKWRPKNWIIAACCFCLLLAGITIFLGTHRQQNRPQSSIDMFWSPAFNSPQPVLDMFGEAHCLPAIIGTV